MNSGDFGMSRTSMVKLIMVETGNTADTAAQADAETESLSALSRRVLGEDHLSLDIESCRIDENFKDGTVRIRIQIREGSTGMTRELAQEGTGVVDLVLGQFIAAYQVEYVSLNNIRVTDFVLKADADPQKIESSYNTKPVGMAESVPGAGVSALAVLQMRNAAGRTFEFRKRSPSLTRAAVGVVRDAIEFFINCERAFIVLRHAFEDAKERNRMDLVARFRNEMAALVAATNYDDVETGV